MSAWCDIHECWLGRWQSADLVDDRRFEDGVLRRNGDHPGDSIPLTSLQWAGIGRLPAVRLRGPV